ncbi:MAG: autotransporter outer membrane beta-barrel domain-containing protein [Treponema sp.]|nr:autotransporter outer membrane beta-barrel domain-containing protein [Treponema sp.]
MKKIVALGAIAALAGGMIFADEPAVDIKLAEFNGNATAKWGVDLDAGQTGFTNTEGDLNIKLNLWNEGEKSTTGDGIWGEIKIKGKALAIRGKDGRSANNVEITTKTFIDAADIAVDDNGTPADESDDKYYFNTTELKKDGDKYYFESESTGKMKDWDGDAKVELDTAKIHFGDKFYIGIKKGDAQVGEYKFDGAIRSADNDNAKWITNVGPDKYSQGIVLGYGDDNFGLDIDLRSYFDDDVTHTNYTNSYAFAAEAQLKDTNSFVSGLSVDVGAGYNITDKFSTRNKDNGLKSVTKFSIEDSVDAGGGTTYGIEGTNLHALGYSARVGYKLSLDDKKYVKPVVGLTGTYTTFDTAAVDDVSKSTNTLFAGVMFGLGETKDSDAGVYYLSDGDQTKKITPGFSVVAAIPFDTVYNVDGDKLTVKDKIAAVIVPSAYIDSDVVEGLKFAAYSEMAFLKESKASDFDGDITVYNGAKDNDERFAIALAAGVAYDIKSGDLTITPKAGVRFANEAFFDNEINDFAPLSNHKIFESGYDKMGVSSGDGYLNLKAGVDVNGLIDNTTVFAEYESANLLNDTDYDEKHYNVKLGTFNIGAKIHF